MKAKIPTQWSIGQLRREVGDRAAIWTTPSVRDRVTKTLPWPVIEPGFSVPPGTQWLVVCGGGQLMDQAKAFRVAQKGLKLVLIPTIWGSGAEASPVIVSSVQGRKEFRIDDAALPDAIAYWPELARSVPQDRQRAACGDCWAHALEGFFSPLGTPDLRSILSAVIKQMLQLPLAFDPRWFEMSSLAAAGQAQASAGLVHGIAHTLEGPLRQGQPQGNWHHAQLCSVFLWPVMRVVGRSSGKAADLLAEHGLSFGQIRPPLIELFDANLHASAALTLRREWPRILRDPCTRTNSVLVRPGWLPLLEQVDFS